MRHSYSWLFLIAAACSQQTSSETEAYRVRHHRPSPHHALDASAPDAAEADAEADAATEPDAGAPVDAAIDTGSETPDASNPVEAGSSFIPSGWLYTQGNKVYVSNGTSGSVWVGRGVNADDLYFCGYNGSLWMNNPGSTVQTLLGGLVSTWKPSFVRVSLGMNSYTPASWTTNPAAYKTPMTSVVQTLGETPGVYVLVTLRSDATMTNYGSDDATYLPTTATDAVYTALVDTFATDPYVLFGISNEPGGNALSDSAIRSAMDHAVGVIRAEENKLGVPHHIVSVQGNDWTSDISFYGTSPLSWDNVVYEVHGYPPATASYTYSNIPVIVGEYGNLPNAGAFFADIESKQIPSLAWDFDSFSDCSPDLLTINQSATSLLPSAWGATVQAYLLAH
ncbi:MAG TPA: cellulase family glycosylhydrolase [Polyangiaceae bacterium]|jgi:hypothetical protein